MATTTVYSDGNGNITVNGVTMTAQQYLAQGGAAGFGMGAAQPSQATLDGRTMLQQFLNNYGLSGINLDSAWNAYVSSGSNIDYWSNTWLPQQAAFKAAYPAYDQLMKEGRGITVADYRNYQLNAYAEAHAAGFPDGTVNQDTITSWLLGGVNGQEAQQRILDASKAVNGLDKNSKAYLQLREMGVSDGDLAGVFFDEKNALPSLENKLAAAQVGGAAASAGFDLGTNLANQLALAGVSQPQAQQGFGQLANSKELLGALPGQTGPTISQDRATSAVFGQDANAARQLQRRAAQREATFQQGGGFTQTNQGFTGAGASKGA
jgi:hypothetical protein